MFVRYHLELPVAAAQVEQTLADAAPGWLASLSTAAQERAEGLAAQVGVGVGAGPKGGAAPETGARSGGGVGSEAGARSRGGGGSEAGVAPEARSGRRVALELGPPVHLPTMTWLPLRREPLGVDGLLPRLDATIELGSLGQDRTQLAISAQFEPHWAGPRASTGAWLNGSPKPPSRTSWTSWVTPSS